MRLREIQQPPLTSEEIIAIEDVIFQIILQDKYLILRDIFKNKWGLFMEEVNETLPEVTVEQIWSAWGGSKRLQKYIRKEFNGYRGSIPIGSQV